MNSFIAARHIVRRFEAGFGRSLAVAACFVLLAASAEAQPRVYVATESTAACVADEPCPKRYVSVVNTATRQVEGVLETWRHQQGNHLSITEILVHPDRERVYVVMTMGFTGQNGIPGSLWTEIDVYSSTTFQRIKRLTRPFGGSGGKCAWAADNRRILCSVNGVDQYALRVVDTVTDAVSVHRGLMFSNGIAATSPGRYIHQSGSTSSTEPGGGACCQVGVLNAGTYERVTNVTLPESAGLLRSSVDGSRVYALLQNSVAEIDAVTHAAATGFTALGGNRPADLALTATHAYVSTFNTSGNTGIVVFDTSSRQAVTTISVPGRFLAASYDEARVFFSDASSLGVISTATNAVVDTIAVGGTVGVITPEPPPAGTHHNIDKPAAGGTVTQPFEFGGWAAHVLGAGGGPGVSTVHTWAFPAGGGDPIFVGASYGRPRSDIAGMFGSTYLNTGYQLTVQGMRPGAYLFRAYAFDLRTGGFTLTAERNVTIAPSAQLAVDSPAANATVPPAFPVTGWALDTAAASGVGVDAIHVWAYPAGGANPIFLGQGTHGIERPDVGAAYGSQFTNSGYGLVGRGLPAGQYTLVVFAKSARSQQFEVSRAVPITVASGLRVAIDAPAHQSTVGSTFVVGGWALDLAAPAGSGVDAVHIWAYPVSGGAPVGLGSAPYGGGRPDVGGAFGAQFTESGFTKTVTGLAAGTYDLAIFARSTVTGTFGPARVVRVTVQ